MVGKPDKKTVLKTTLFWLALVGALLLAPTFYKMDSLTAKVYAIGVAVVLYVGLVDLVRTYAKYSREELEVYVADTCHPRDFIDGKCIPRRYSWVVEKAVDLGGWAAIFVAGVIVAVIVFALLWGIWMEYNSLLKTITASVRP